MNHRRVFALWLLLGLVLPACGVRIQAAPGPEAEAPPGLASVPAATPADGPVVAVTDAFLWVEIPANSPANHQIQVEALDEVTGLPFNPQITDLRAVDATHYGAVLRLPVGTVLKYRYIRVDADGRRVAETASDGRALRYRLLYVDGPSEVHDLVARWADTPAEKATGRLQGLAADASSGAGIPNLLIVAGGQQTLSRADGFFQLDGLPAGTHQVTAYSMDGGYQTFKQNALVAAEATTPVALQLQPLRQVQVTFEVTLPGGMLPDLPVRLAGNLSLLGNAFSDLGGGISGLAAAMPLLRHEGDGRYSLTLTLPAGTEILYKYTLGDGYWNAERAADLGFMLRRVVIPNNVRDYRIRDRVLTFQSSSATAPVWFDVNVQAFTPPGEALAIQFQVSETWLAPVPLWPVSEDRWAFALFGPALAQETLTYRYCRNSQCGGEVAIATERDPALRAAPLNSGTAVVQVDHIREWTNFGRPEFAATVLDNPVVLRPAGFTAGVQFAAGFLPGWGPALPGSLENIQKLKANTVVFTPGWLARNAPTPLFELRPGTGPDWQSLVNQIEQAEALGLRAGLNPQLDMGTDPATWWAAAPRDAAWWQVWFEQYRAFILHHADLAQTQGAAVLVLGGGAIAPALPGGAPDQPADTAQRWQRLLDEVRLHYGGTVAFALPFHEEDTPQPDFLKNVDVIFLEWGAALGVWEGATLSEMHSRAVQLLNQHVRPLQESLGRPVVLLAAYPSATGGLTQCVPAGEGCLALGALAPGQPEHPEAALNLAEQMEVYNALLAALNDSPWLSGFISAGYYPPVALLDKSTSIHGKPAESVLGYWFGRLLGD